LIDRSIWVGLT